ncbi:S-adenosyl-L-methionine-dependent methyltransferase [Lipomyces oligophaga]|uniref:S-adenosyl-L-methionine-dependent methyltransferase n=1 Tax=Lipomyces oligophaga TaxID=45792 RepID=UPI0034CEB61E
MAVYLRQVLGKQSLTMSKRYFGSLNVAKAPAHDAHPTSTAAFNTNHSLYDQFRPSHYPAAADALIGKLELPPNAHVLDLACGTGKFTALLENRGFEITAVDASEGMLASFKKNYPTIPAQVGSSYSIPAKDHSLDALFCAQAFHWFADLESLKEFHRVLKPTTGKLALIWNFDPSADESSVWQRKVAELCWDNDAHLPQFRHMNWKKVFESSGAVDLFEMPPKFETMFWSFKIKPQDVYQLWLTKSYITELSDLDKLKIKAGIEQILDAHAKELYDQDGLLDYYMGVYYTWTTAKP